MPSFITHIVFAEKIYPALEPNTPNESAFLIGNLFPDIRRLNVLKRNQTHFNHIKKSSIQTAECFYTGVLTHNLLDIIFMQHSLRQKYIDNLGSPSNWYQVYIAMTMYLDMLLVHELKHDLSYYIALLNKTELTDISRWEALEIKHVETWHKNLQRYFKKPPTSFSMARATLIEWEYPQDQINNIVKLLKSFKKNKNLTKDAEAFIQNAINTFHRSHEWGRDV